MEREITASVFLKLFQIAKALHKERRECEHGEWALFRWAYH